MATYKPGERDMFLKNGHMIYWDDRWEALREMLLADKDRILAALQSEKDNQQEETESLSDKI